MARIRVFGDIENNEAMQKAFAASIAERQLGRGITVFLGDIFDPSFGMLENEEFVEKTFFPAIKNVTPAWSRTGHEYDSSHPLESFEALLKTMAPNSRASLTDYGEWSNKSFNFRSRFTEGCDVQELVNARANSTIFILGNKEVQMTFDICDGIRKGTMGTTLLPAIYKYLDQCVDCAVINDDIFIHYAYNAAFSRSGFRRIISGHIHKAYLRGWCTIGGRKYPNIVLDYTSRDDGHPYIL